jgi:tRNA(Ile)-lysidine synthetase-like protein
MLKALFSLLKFDNKYNKILQYVPYENNIPITISHEEPLCKLINDYYKNDTDQIIVSLSGGVDSMVLITILKFLQYNVIAVFINYNNRTECVLEQEFLTEWCKINNIILYTRNITEFKRTDINRTEYEINTKNIRFKFYKTITYMYNTDSVVLAHHKDDVIENIVANIFRGRNILDIAIMKKTAYINNINIIRPFIDIYKDEIYQFANKYKIPYFKDTTPEWSIRGKYRNLILPSLEFTFSNNVKDNLLKLSKQSDEWNSLIQEKIMFPFISTIQFNNTYCDFICKEYITYPISFWTQVFMKIFYHYGKKQPSQKAINCFIITITSNNNCDISLSNACTCKNSNYKITITFK